MMLTLEDALNKASEFLNQEKYSDAEHIYRFLQKQKSNHPDVLAGLARVRRGYGKKEIAYNFLIKAISTAPNFIPFYIQMAEWNLQDGNYKTSCKYYEKAIELGLNPLNIVDKASLFKEKCGGNGISNLPIWVLEFSKARNYVKNKDWIKAWESVLKSCEEGMAVHDGLNREVANIALHAHKFEEAIKYFSESIKNNPNDPDAWLNLGSANQNIGEMNVARLCYLNAMNLRPNIPEAYNNLGVLEKVNCNYNEAIINLKRAVELRPEYSSAWNNLGLAYRLLNKLQDASDAFERGLYYKPNELDLLLNLGAIKQDLGKTDEARHLFEKCNEISNGNIIALTNIGVIEFKNRNFDLAKNYYQKAIAIDSNWNPAKNNLGVLEMEIGNLYDAIKNFQEVLRKDPDFVDALNNLGICFRQVNRLAEARVVLEKVIKIQPEHPEALSNLGFVYQDCGEFDKAIYTYEKLLNLSDGKKLISAWNNYLFCTNYSPHTTQKDNIERYNRFDSEMGKAPNNAINAKPSALNGRKLRVGYVSGDFKKHPQQKFFDPFLDWHDRDKFEIFCYSNVFVEDAVTESMRNRVFKWRRIHNLSNENIANLIYKDQIDVLVDLAGHTGGNRVQIYTYKAAPVQLSTQLGWNYGVGLSCMDGLIGDILTLPLECDTYSVEKIIRLPVNTYVCRMDMKLPILEKNPFLSNGYITFGTTTRTVRLNNLVFDVWAKVLLEVNNSKLMFNSRNFKDPYSITRVKKEFKKRGVDEDRIICDFTSPIELAFSQIDIYLDTFPHNNGTTLVEALWFGLPVITMRSRPPFGCIGEAILSNIDKKEWIAYSESQYVKIASDLAINPNELIRIRVNQRQEISNTKQFDEIASVREFESAYMKIYSQKLGVLH